MSTYKIDSTHSEITFKVKHLMLQVALQNLMQPWKLQQQILVMQVFHSKQM